MCSRSYRWGQYSHLHPVWLCKHAKEDLWHVHSVNRFLTTPSLRVPTKRVMDGNLSSQCILVVAWWKTLIYAAKARLPLLTGRKWIRDGTYRCVTQVKGILRRYRDRSESSLFWSSSAGASVATTTTRCASCDSGLWGVRFATFILYRPVYGRGRGAGDSERVET